MASRIRLNVKKIFTDSCDVYRYGVPTDVYNLPETGMPTVVVQAAVPCRLLPLVSKKGGEKSADAQFTKSYYTLFIMPLSGGYVLSEKVWIVMAGTTDFYNVVQAIPPVIDGAPFELTMTKVKF